MSNQRNKKKTSYCRDSVADHDVGSDPNMFTDPGYHLFTSAKILHKIIEICQQKIEGSILLNISVSGAYDLNISKLI